MVYFKRNGKGFFMITILIFGLATWIMLVQMTVHILLVCATPDDTGAAKNVPKYFLGRSH